MSTITAAELKKHGVSALDPAFAADGQAVPGCRDGVAGGPVPDRHGDQGHGRPAAAAHRGARAGTPGAGDAARAPRPNGRANAPSGRSGP